MELDKLRTVLEQTFGANFVSYYRAHAAHINIVGRTFSQDHELLGKVYEYFQDNIDTLGEKLRTVRTRAPNSINNILGVSPMEDKEVTGSADDYLAMVLDSIDIMIDQYHELNIAAEDANYIDIANFTQDQIGILAKYRWMLESTLEIADED